MKANYIRAAIFVISFLLSIIVLKAQGLQTVVINNFDVRSRNGNVELTWKTSSEEQLRQFEIEYSTDGKYFINLGFIPAVNKPINNIYQFEHAVNYSDSALYRLKIVDNAGRWKYTDPISYHINKLTKYFVYPSVITTGVMNIFVEDPFEALQVVSMNGTVMLKQQLSGKTGRINIPLSANMSSGTYVVQLLNRNRSITQKVIVQ